MVTNLLEYENQMFLDAFHEDGLLVTARGLGVQRIFLSFIKLYCDPANLVLVLNTSSQEEDYFIELLQNSGTKPLPRVITTEYNANERQSIYLEGGVLFITSRILVVDMLTDRVPINLISGILVYKAHKIIEACQEAFILRLYRQKNKTGFVKAFSDSPQSFTSGFCHVERMMKSLFVTKLFLWPRFHASTVACLDRHKVDVVELHLQMTNAMVSCQTAILDLISVCTKELKQCNQWLDMEEITVENALTKNFDKSLRHLLDPVWHQLGQKTRQLVSDLKTLRLILEHLTQYDCVNFYNLINSIRSSEKTFGQNTGWLFTDSADSLYLHAKERVFGSQNKSKKSKQDDEDKNKETNIQNVSPEECPKWKALAEVLQEIEEENKTVDPSVGPGRALVVAQDDRTCSQLKQYLCEGGITVLNRLVSKLVGHQVPVPTDQPKKVSKSANEDKDQPRGKGGSKVMKKTNDLTLTQMIDVKPDDDTSTTKNGDKESEEPEEEKEGDREFIGRSADAYYGVLKAPVTILHPLHGSSDPNSLLRTLEEVQPRYVVLYDADMAFVRQLEVYRASRPGTPLRVYFLMYSASTEEQRYLTTLRKEKEAFEYLIKQKASMVVTAEQAGKMEEDPELARDMTPANATVNTRKGGIQKIDEQTQKIIVDMREFRSQLPSLIHRRGIDIDPVTIEVGDYILTPDICVERKSLSDLIGSLNSGRLYNQCVSMSRYYKKPVLLIEFDPDKAFSLQANTPLSSEISSHDVLSKLTLLTLHFPRLRILWCQSPYATAELFEELKQGRAQPDSAAAMAISEGSESELSTKYNLAPQNMLLKMPGINSKNVYAVMNAVESIAELTSLSEEELQQILGATLNAKLLWDFLHGKHQPNEQAVSTKPTSYKFPKQGARGGRGGTSSRGIKRKR